MEHHAVSHSGMPGMRWGVRRYRNYDGTLTPEGKIRYGKSGSGETTSRKSGTRSKSTSPKKTVSDMSDDELRTKTARLQLETNYIRASTEYRKLTAPKESAIVQSGRKILQRAFEDVGTEVMKNVIKNTATALTGMQFNNQNDKNKDKDKDK